MNKPIVTLIGFILLTLGVLSFCLSLVGIKFSFLTFLDAAGTGYGLLFKVMMIIIGIVLIVISRTNFDGGTLPD